ncbi:MAG: hypothetical protein F6K31_19515 [Symploca sp. SIO2G7]|nr:hypothetical protein [Symploca sp. SIO2G7]
MERLKESEKLWFLFPSSHSSPSFPISPSSPSSLDNDTFSLTCHKRGYNPQ